MPCYLSEWLSSKRLQTAGVEGMLRKGNPSTLWKTVWWFLNKLKIKLPYDAAIPLLDIHSKKTKTLI